jgi:hypothetical protein
MDTLDFTVLDHRDGEWDSADGTRYRFFLDTASGSGFFRWDQVAARYGAWVWHGLMVFDGPFTRVDRLDELGEYAGRCDEYGCVGGEECECDGWL